MENKELDILVKKVSSGDKGAFLTLCEEKYFEAYQHAFRILGNHHDAEDVAQNSMLSVYENIGQLRDTNSFTPWFKQLVRSMCFNYLRANKKKGFEIVSYKEEKDMRVEDSRDWIPDENVELNESEKQIAKILNTLKTQYKQVITLYYYEGLSYKEISEIMEVNMNTVATNIKRAKDAIKKELRKTSDIEIIFDDEEQ